MKQTNPLFRFWQLSLPFLLLSAILFLPSFDKIEEDPEKLTTEYLLDPTNTVMCAPLNRFELDIETATAPMAPVLKPNWISNFTINSNAEAKPFFDQGIFNMYSFNHAEAERAFKEAVRLDPSCAMCHWGVALALGPNINRPMQADYNEEAYKFSRKAVSLAENGPEREIVLANALATRYAKNPPEDRAELDLAYANEMRIVAHRYREDLNIATFFAESLMDLIPWDYWQADESPKPETREMHAVLDYVLEKDPDHPGANHYYIHSVESIYPNRAEKCADKLKELNYNSGHLVHMPSHIYVRLGRYHDATLVNVDAIKVDEDYIERCQAQGFYPALYYPHNLHFLWFAATMEGQSEIAMDAARKLVVKTPKDMLAVEASLERYYTIPSYSLVRFGKWDEILKEPKPGDDLIYTQAIWHYARGMAYAKKDKLKNALEELQILEAATKNETIAALDNPAFPTVGMTAMAFHVLKAEIEGKNNNFDAKIEHLQKAVDLQDAMIYMEPPWFNFPARQALGAALLEANRAAEAEKVYKEDLDVFLQNGWSLYGLHKSLKMQGKKTEADEIWKEFKESWKFADVKLKSSVI